MQEDITGLRTRILKCLDIDMLMIRTAWTHCRAQLVFVVERLSLYLFDKFCYALRNKLHAAPFDTESSYSFRFTRRIFSAQDEALLHSSTQTPSTNDIEKRNLILPAKAYG
jgi:hypothetical protein